MKRMYFLVILGLVFCFLSSSTQAQLSRTEKKEWKTKAKEYKKYPERLKALLEEYNSLKSKTGSLENQIKSLQAKLGDKDSKISDLTDENENLKAELSSAKRKMKELMARPKPATDDESGVVFKVQIGAFGKDKGMTEYSEKQKNFAEDKAQEGMTKYTLGVFRDYWEADKFKKELRTMGVKQAWIVSYKDGVRVPIKDVLEGIM